MNRPFDPRHGLVCCRRIDAGQPLRRGYTEASCQLCGQRVQVSPESIAIARGGATVACNPCGMKLAKERVARGGATEVRLQPDAMDAPGMRELIPELAHHRPPTVTHGKDAHGRPTTILDFKGTQDFAPRPERIACDFCMHEADRLWCWQVRAFSAELGRGGRGIEYRGGQWRACVFCRPLVAEGDWRTLEARVRIMCPALELVPPDALMATWRAVFAALESEEVREWHSGMPFPGRKEEF